MNGCVLYIVIIFYSSLFFYCIISKILYGELCELSFFILENVCFGDYLLFRMGSSLNCFWLLIGWTLDDFLFEDRSMGSREYALFIISFLLPIQQSLIEEIIFQQFIKWYSLSKPPPPMVDFFSSFSPISIIDPPLLKLGSLTVAYENWDDWLNQR